MRDNSPTTPLAREAIVHRVMSGQRPEGPARAAGVCLPADGAQMAGAHRATSQRRDLYVSRTILTPLATRALFHKAATRRADCPQKS